MLGIEHCAIINTVQLYGYFSFRITLYITAVLYIRHKIHLLVPDRSDSPVCGVYKESDNISAKWSQQKSV